MNALIDYFTGTGNSAHASDILEKELSKKGFNTKSRVITKSTKPVLPEIDLYIVVFPVYALTIPHLFERHLKKLPEMKNLKTVIIANFGMLSIKGGIDTGYEGPSLDKAYKILKKKKFNVVLTETVGYPENITIIMNAPSDKNQDEIIKNGDRKIKIIAKKILSDEKCIKKYNILEKIFSPVFSFLFLYFGRIHIGKFFIANGFCNNCSLCSKLCPAKTIKMINNKPKWGYGCEGCLKCYNLCPKASIQISLLRLIILISASIIPAILLIYNMNFFIRKISSIIPSFIYSNILFKTTSFIILYFPIFVLTFISLEFIIFILEQLPNIRKIFELSYTRKIKRCIYPKKF